MKFLREPLVHFLLIGAALFGIFAIFGRSAGEAPAGVIVITPGLVENLKLSFVRSAGRPLTAADLDAMIEDYVREEIFCREAAARGLDKDDPIVRRELRLRMDSFYEDSVQLPPPTDDELRAFFEKHAGDFQRPGGPMPDFAEIRPDVQDAWARAQRKDALAAAYKKLRARYKVILPPPVNPPEKK